MSGISDFYDQLFVILESLFPNKNELVDPENIEENDYFTLKDGYGVLVSSADNTNRVLDCQYSVNRSFIITITKAIESKENNTSERRRVTKLLLEEHCQLVSVFMKNETLGETVTKYNWVSDGGVENIIRDKTNIVMIQLLVESEYIENFKDITI